MYHGFDSRHAHHALLVQWIEQQSSKLCVIGSIPIRGTVLEAEADRPQIVALRVVGSSPI